MPIDFNAFIQIAGIRDLDEANRLIDCGVRHLGFPLRLPVNLPDLSETEAAQVVRALPPHAHAIAITYQNDADEVLELLDDLGASAVQLHGDIEAAELQRLKQKRPAVQIIKSLVVGAKAVDDLCRTVDLVSEHVDAFITDTFDPDTGATGATGKTHDWQISRELVNRSLRPVILAGGLTPENVHAAILHVRPAGVDAHTGVEDAAGRKDDARVRTFVQQAAAAFRAIRPSPTSNTH